jgi:tRNA modification GTPase
MVIDGSEPLHAEDVEIARLAEGRPTVAVVNKSDLPALVDLSGFLLGTPRALVSALTGDGLDMLREVILDKVLAGEVLQSDSIFVTSTRHKEILSQAAEHVQGTLETLSKGLPADFATIDLRAALDGLGEITGQTFTEDLLDNIFSNFCIGK